MSEPRDDITLLEGRRYFEAMFEAIDAAQEEVLAETYVFQFDRTGSEFIERASRAARRGVRVRMIADGLGSPQLTLAGEQRVRDAGIDLVVHHRPGFIPLAALHGRMHRKLLVVDRREVFLGGLNIADEYAGLDVPGSFYDLAVRIRGPIASEAADLAQDLFTESSMSTAELVWARLRHTRDRRARQNDPRNRLVGRDNHARRNSIEREYRRAIQSATRSIVLAHAYFLPSRGLLEALCAAARRGVDTVVLVQGRAEHPVLRSAQWHLYHRLLRAGARVYEYQRRFLHAKVMAVDGRWSTIGSSNLEPWSLTSNLELNLVSEDPSLAAKITAEIESRLPSECVRVESSQLGLVARALSAIAYRAILGVFVITGGRSDRRWRPATAPNAAASRDTTE